GTMDGKCGKGDFPLVRLAVSAAAVAAVFATGAAHAYKIDADPDWKINLDNSVMYTAGWRAQSINPTVANNPFFHQGESRIAKGDMVTNRVQDLIEFQAIYQDN